MIPEHVRTAVVRSARSLWSRNVHDRKGDPPTTPSNRIITSLFDDNGWAHWLRSETGGGCPNGYQRPPDPDYCGHGFAAFYRGVGDHLVPARCVNLTVNRELARRIFPSTDRIAGHGPAQASWEAVDAQRIEIDAAELLPADLAVVETSGHDPWGDHIVLPATAPDAAGWFTTYEANASGTRADETRGKGIVVRRRNVREVRTAIRSHRTWFEGDAAALALAFQPGRT